MNNESAIEFYKKFGFNIVETKEQYYKRIEPADAHVLVKFLKEDHPTRSAIPICRVLRCRDRIEYFQWFVAQGID